MTFEVRNGCFGYKKTVPILKNISFCVERRPSKTACQVIIGTKVQFVYDELKKML